MASRRMIKSNIWEDEFIGELSVFQRLVWIGLFSSVADDQGRLLDNPVIIRAKLFPYDDISVTEIEEALKAFDDAEKIQRYSVGGKKLIQILRWWENQNPQWAQPSSYPPPAGWLDGIRTRMNNQYFEENWNKKGMRSDEADCDQPDICSDDPTDTCSDNCSGERSPELTSRTVRAGGQYPDPVQDPDPDPDPVPGEQICALACEKQQKTGDQTGDQAGDDDFTRLQHALESVIGLPISPGDIPPIQQMIKIGATRADIQAAAEWMVSTGKTIRYVGQLYGPVEVAVAKRHQALLPRSDPPASAGRKNGKATVDYDSKEFRDRYKLPEDLQPGGGS